MMRLNWHNFLSFKINRLTDDWLQGMQCFSGFCRYSSSSVMFEVKSLRVNSVWFRWQDKSLQPKLRVDLATEWRFCSRESQWANRHRSLSWNLNECDWKHLSGAQEGTNTMKTSRTQTIYGSISKCLSVKSKLYMCLLRFHRQNLFVFFCQNCSCALIKVRFFMHG